MNNTKQVKTSCRMLASPVTLLCVVVLRAWSKQCSPATNITINNNDIGQFAVLSGSGSCQPNENSTFECVPSDHFESMYWLQTTNDLMTCYHSGDQSGNKSVLHLPCGSYTLQCVYIANGGRRYHSPSIAITTVRHCRESSENTVSFQCPSSGPDSGVAVVTWKIGNRTLPSSRGRWLDVPCLASYHGLRVECTEQYQDGGTAKMHVGFLNVTLQSERTNLNQGVDEDDRISTKSTDTPTTDDGKMDALIQLSLNQVIVAAVSLVTAIALLMLCIATLIFFLWKYYRKYNKTETNKDGRDQGSQTTLLVA